MANQPDDPFEQMGIEFREALGLPHDELKNRKFAKMIWFLMAMATAVALWSTWFTLVGRP